MKIRKFFSIICLFLFLPTDNYTFDQNVSPDVSPAGESYCYGDFPKDLTYNSLLSIMKSYENNRLIQNLLKDPKPTVAKLSKKSVRLVLFQLALLLALHGGASLTDIAAISAAGLFDLWSTLKLVNSGSVANMSFLQNLLKDTAFSTALYSVKKAAGF